VQAAAAHERVELKAGFACEPDLYWRTWRPIVSEVTVQAKAQGFLSARFEWSANGSTLFRHGAWATAQFGARVEVREPDGTVTPRGNTTTITYLITDSWNASTLQIRNTEFVGNCTLSIEAAATEVGAKWTPVKGSTPADVMAIEVDLKDRFYDDRDRCNPQWTKLNSDLLELSEAVFILKTLPDPAPDQAIIRLLERSAEVLAAASEVGASTGQSASQVLADRMARRRLRPSFETVGGMTRTSQDLDEVAPDAIPELAPRGDE